MENKALFCKSTVHFFKTLYHTIRLSTQLRKEAFENILGKGENAGYQHFLLFLKCFLPFPKQISNFSVASILLSESSLKLDWSKISLFGKKLES